VSGPETVLVPVVSDGARQGEEVLPVVAVGPSRFRLVASPGMVEGLAAGDEFELAPDVPLGYRVLARGGNLCVWFYFEHPVSEHDPETTDVRRVAEALGGWLDGGYSRMVVFTVPLSAGFAAVAGAFDGAAARYRGAVWYYGNVYDPRDGETPLNWWLP
jgi:hypothetical protein